MKLKSIYRLNVTNLISSVTEKNLDFFKEALETVGLYENDRFYGLDHKEKIVDLTKRVKIRNDLFRLVVNEVLIFSSRGEKFNKEGRDFKLLLTFDSTPQGHVSITGEFHYVENNIVTNILEPFHFYEDPYKRFDI